MLGETHRRIARRISQELGLGEKETRTFESGSTSPDNLESFPHNKGKKFQIIERIIQARIFFLEGDIRCFEFLGIALHYIQDRWTLFSRTEKKYTPWEMQLNLESVLEDERLENRILALNLPVNVQRSYLSFLQKIKKGIGGLDEEEVIQKGKRVFEGLCEKVTIFALLERPAALSDPILDLNFSYRICLEVASFVVRPVNQQELQAMIQISLSDRELTSLSSKLRGFPDSYLERNWEVFRLEELGNVNEKNMVQINEVFEEWIKNNYGADFAIYPSYGNTIEDMQEKFRLTIRMEIRERKGSTSTNPHSLPNLRIDFSSYEQAKYAEEAYFEILPQQIKEPIVADRIGFIIESILKTKFPVDTELLTEILAERVEDIEKANNLQRIVRDLKRIHEPSWNDRNNLKNRLALIPSEYKINLITN